MDTIYLLPGEERYVDFRDTNREIAKSLGLTDEVVRTRLFRGRKLLWKEMNSHE